VVVITAAIAQATSASDAQICGAEPANEVLVDFSTALAQVEALGAEVASGDGITVRFSAPGTGVMLTAPEDAWDLHEYVAIAIDVRNVGTGSLTLIGELNGQSWTNSFLHVPAGKTDTMIIHMLRKELNDDRETQFTGMRGVPGGHMSHWVDFDTRAVKTVSLRDLDGVSVGQTVQVEAVRAVGKYGPLSLEKANTFFPFVDRFGQFKHHDWPGKVKLAADIKRLADEESEDLTKNPVPANWSRYGGWLNGPKLQATGHFRVEKNGGKWWLVDPEGHLFWSHGVDCVRFTAETKTGSRRSYFETLPDGFHTNTGVDFAKANQYLKYGLGWEDTAAELAQRRLRSWGMNTVGNWSDSKAYTVARQPYVVAIHYGGWGKEAVVDLIRNPDALRVALRERLEQEKGETN
jgi:hypothetical protein